MRLLRRRQYQRVIRKGNRRTGEFVAIDVYRGRGELCRLGITVTTKFGKANKRNRFKRIVREAFRLCQHNFPPGSHIHVRPLPPVKNANTNDIAQDLLALLGH